MENFLREQKKKAWRVLQMQTLDLELFYLFFFIKVQVLLYTKIDHFSKKRFFYVFQIDLIVIFQIENFYEKRYM